MQSGFNKDAGAKQGQSKERAGVYFPFLISTLQSHIAGNTDNVLRVKNVRVEKVQAANRGHTGCQNSWTQGRKEPLDSDSQRFNWRAGSPSVQAACGRSSSSSERYCCRVSEILARNHIYVKIICAFKHLDNQVVFIVDHVEEIKDFNLITNHILCSVHALLSVDNDVKLEGGDAAATVDVMMTSSAMKEEYTHLSGEQKVPKNDSVRRHVEVHHRKIQKRANLFRGDP